MRKVVVLTGAMFLVLVLGMAAAVIAGEAAPATMTMEGYIIDTRCATANQATLADFVKTHPKDCTMAPACSASGYNIYSNGKLYKFDKDSSDKVYDFLGKPDSTLSVKAEVEMGPGDTVKLVSIENK